MLQTLHRSGVIVIMRSVFLSAIGTVAFASALHAQAKGPTSMKHAAHDSAFAAMQERGKMAMGVDQYASTHHFDALPDGGRIELVRDDGDSADVARIRAHIREIAHAFKAGDFSTPSMVHMQHVPGTEVMASRRASITYEPRDVPRGAELRIRTTDPQALRAIHEFMAFQRGEHHAGGMVDTSSVSPARKVP
jgi:TusA-related sulfurtransferase